MAKIIFESWQIGMRPIPFVKLLHEKVGLSLSEAKHLKDSFINDNKSFQIEIADEILAKEILEKSKEYNVKCRIERI